MTLSLQRTSTGWALVDEHDQVVFEADGPDARRRSLAHAKTAGTVCLRFDEQLPAA